MVRPVGFKHSEETKRKIGLAHKGKKLSENHILQLSKFNRERLKDKTNHHMYGKKHSKESREKMSVAHTGKIMSDEVCRNFSIAQKLRYSKKGNPLKGRKLTKEHREKIRKNNAKYWLGKKRSKETVEKVSKTLTGKYCGVNSPIYGRKHSKESIDKMRHYRIGKKASLETRKKMSVSLSGKNHPFYGKKLSEEHRINLSKSHFGYEMPDEQREKISFAMVKYKSENKGQWISKLDEKFELLLNNTDLIFESQVGMVHSVVDFYIAPDIVVFCDGDYWHNLDSHKKRDFYVNNKLRENGFLVLRFWEHEIHENSDKCIDKIKRSVCWYE